MWTVTSQLKKLRAIRIIRFKNTNAHEWTRIDMNIIYEHS